MKRGVVLQVGASEVVVLTPDGQFCRVRREPGRAYIVGEEICFFPEEPRRRAKRVGALGVVAVAACLALVVAGGLFWMTAQPVMAYVALDINPSVEMGIDERYRVIDLAGLNPDGERLVARLPQWKGRGLAEVTADVLAQARREGYLNQGRDVIVTTTVFKGEDNPQRVQKIARSVEQTVKTVAVQKGVEVRALVATPALRAEARAKGLPTGRYLLGQEQERNRILPGAHGGKESDRSHDTRRRSEGQGHPFQGKKGNDPGLDSLANLPQLNSRDHRKAVKPDPFHGREKAGKRDAEREEAKESSTTKRKTVKDNHRETDREKKKRGERDTDDKKQRDSREERSKRAAGSKDRSPHKPDRRHEGR